MAIRSDPGTATAKWVQNLSSASTAIQRGVNAVQTAPGQLAAAQSQKWAQRTADSADKWKRRVGAVSLQSWQASMLNVGVQRISQGAAAKQAKYQSFATEFFPHLESGVAKVKAMPSLTLQDNINRAVAMIQHNAGFRRSGA